MFPKNGRGSYIRSSTLRSVDAYVLLKIPDQVMLDAYKLRPQIHQEFFEVPGICIVGARQFIDLLVYADAPNAIWRSTQRRISIFICGNRERYE